MRWRREEQVLNDFNRWGKRFLETRKDGENMKMYFSPSLQRTDYLVSFIHLLIIIIITIVICLIHTIFTLVSLPDIARKVKNGGERK